MLLYLIYGVRSAPSDASIGMLTIRTRYAIVPLVVPLVRREII